MSAKNDGGPAFPTSGWQDGSKTPLGMSLRDWFAGNETLAEWDCPEASAPHKMCEALAGRPKPANGWACNTHDEYIDMLRWEADWRAALKYIRADAMLKAREQ